MTRHRRTIAQVALLVYVLNPLVVTAQVIIQAGEGKLYNNGSVILSGTAQAGGQLNLKAANNLTLVSCPSVRDTFGVEFQPLFFQRSTCLGWFLTALRHCFFLRCARFSAKTDTHAGMAPTRCGQCCSC